MRSFRFCFLICHDLYLFWSTGLFISPLSFSLSLDDFEIFWQHELGQSSRTSCSPCLAFFFSVIFSIWCVTDHWFTSLGSCCFCENVSSINAETCFIHCFIPNTCSSNTWHDLVFNRCLFNEWEKYLIAYLCPVGSHRSNNVKLLWLPWGLDEII